MDSGVTVAHIAKTYRVPAVVPWRRARTVRALAGVSFQSPARAVTCILGPNGAGKTTLLKILAGLIAPDTGTIAMFGEGLGDVPARLRARIGFANANERSFYARLTGRQNLEFFGALHGLGRAARRTRIDAVLADVELAAAADMPFRLYSAGMKQKLILARALLGAPELLILDEPTTHLDALARVRMRGLIRACCAGERGATVLLATHDLAEAEELADRIVFLNEGAVLAEGPPGALRALLLRAPRVELSFARAPCAGWEHGHGRRIAGDDLRPTLELRDVADIPRLVAAAVAAGGEVLGVARQEPALLEVFADLASKGAP